MSAVVEEDGKGRVLLPVEIRRRLNSKRFKVTEKGGTIVLEPLEPVAALKGKYKDAIHGDWDELEERGEDFVQSGKR